MHLEPRQMDLILSILNEWAQDCEIWAFGSRVHGRGLKPFSDLDLVLKSEKVLGTSYCQKLAEAFEESDLPFRVDVAEWSNLPDWLRTGIELEHRVLQVSAEHETT